MIDFRNYIIGFLVVCALWGQVMSCNRGLNYKRVDRELSLEQAFNSNLRSSYNAEKERMEYEREMLVADKKQLESFLKSRDKELYELRKRTKAQAGVITTTVLVRDTVIAYDTVYKLKPKKAHVFQPWDELVNEFISEGANSGGSQRRPLGQAFSKNLAHFSGESCQVDDSNRDVRVVRLTDEFIDIEIVSRPDSLILKPFIIKDSVEFAVKNGVISILHHNPYVQVTGVKSFKIEQPKKNAKWKFWAGLAAGAVGGYLIFK